MTGDAQNALVRALLARGGAGCRLASAGERPWASITFEGTRHVVEVEMPAVAATAFVEGIEEAEFDLHRHILADLAVAGHEAQAEGLARVRIEALTLLDR